jgi:hypothetical protein
MKRLLLFFLSLALTFMAYQCSTGVESSPDPGILRIIFHGDDSDTSIVIINETYTVDTSDVFMVHIFEGRAYQGQKYAYLYPKLNEYHNPGKNYNILARDSLNQSYKRYKIFETFVPPGNYTRLQIGLTANELRIGDFDPIPIYLPADDSLLISINQDFTVESDHVTEVDLAIKPFASIQRYKDTYLFYRIVTVAGIKILRRD